MTARRRAIAALL